MIEYRKPNSFEGYQKQRDTFYYFKKRTKKNKEKWDYICPEVLVKKSERTRDKNSLRISPK